MRLLKKIVTVEVYTSAYSPITNKEIENLIDYINVADTAFYVKSISKGKIVTQP